MSIEIRHTIAYGPRFDVHVRSGGRTKYLGRFATYRAAEQCMARYWAEEKAMPSESKWTVEAREHVSQLRRRKRGELMNELKKATAAAAVVGQIPAGNIRPQVQARAGHPMDVLHQEGQRLQAKLHQLAVEFNLAQKAASKIERPEPGWWCASRGCRGELAVNGRQGKCNVCARQVDIMADQNIRPRLKLPEVVLIPEGVAEVVRLRRAIEKVEKEIAEWKRARAQAEIDLWSQETANKPGRPSEYPNRTW